MNIKIAMLHALYFHNYSLSSPSVYSAISKTSACVCFFLLFFYLLEGQNNTKQLFSIAPSKNQS